MSWLRRLFAGSPAAPPRDPSSDFWWHGLGASSEAGEHVTVERAIQIPVVYDCVQVLSSTVSTLPRSVVREQSGGGSVPEPRHPVSRLLDNPNPEQTGAEFMAEAVWDLATHGDFIAEMVWTGGRVPSELRRLPPAETSVERLSDGSRRWTTTGQGRQRRLVEGEVWHIRRVPLKDGLTGTGPVEAGRETIGMALALQNFAARFFANDVSSPVVLEHPSNFASAEDRKGFLGEVTRALTGKNRHKPMLLEWGITAKKMGFSNEEAQFLETRRENNVDLARLWRMPPHKVGILDRATFSNIEQQSLEFVIDTLVPWLSLIEAAVAKSLLPGTPGLSYQFNVQGLLRGDIETRFKAYALGRQWGWLSVNEIRRHEGMNPVPAGDVYLQPMNMDRAGQDGDAAAAARQTEILHAAIRQRRPG